MTYYELQNHVEQQLKNYLCVSTDATKYIFESVERTDKCIRAFSNKYNVDRRGADSISFSVFNTVHYSIFLYHMSRVAFEIDGNGNNAEKFYYLNKIMNSLDIFYEVKMPEIWKAEHPLGSIMGRANYGDYFFFYQGCTVGANRGIYPEIGKCVVMFSNSKILGNSKIGNNVIISANTYVKDENIPSNSIVFGQSPHLIIKEKNEKEIKDKLYALCGIMVKEM